MKNIRKGTIVARKSYNKDILFIVKEIIKSDNLVLLNGLTVRITADAPIEDLDVVTKEEVASENQKFENKLKRKKQMYKINNNRKKEYIYTGKILHLDGDKKYTDKSYKYYKRMGLNAIVKYIPENQQSRYVKDLLRKYNPDILVITRT